ncbi:MAG: hypothetical protein FJY77_00370 [Candidatus Altiarchaeales archaeon]|nr:hypothetical protein [Candidatus Altiarchaeales archaeon]
MDVANIFIGTLWMILMILAPGLALSLAIFPKKDEIDIIERLGFSFVFGLLPQVIQYFLDKNFSIPVTTSTTYGLIAAVTLAGLAVWKNRAK